MPNNVNSSPLTWPNRHQVFAQPYLGTKSLHNDHPGDSTQGFNDYLSQIKSIQQQLQQIQAQGVRARGLGSGWSFSKVAANDGYLLGTDQLKVGFTLQAQHVTPAYQAKVQNLYFAQCGMFIYEVHDDLFKLGKSLAVSGSSCNQTIVGAFSTGTHGSAFKGGVPGGGAALHDYVRGLHVILGPGRHVWIARASDPVVDYDQFVSLLGVQKSDFLLDDQLFNAALVSFGSFGLIHGVLLEATDLFLLDASRYYTNFETLKDAVTNPAFTFSGVDLKPPATQDGNPSLYHFEVMLNPFEAKDGNNAQVTVMYKRGYRPDYPAMPQSIDGMGDDLASFTASATQIPIVGGLVDNLGAAAFFNGHYPAFTHQLGTLKEQNPPISNIGPGSIVCSMAMDMKHSYDALTIAEEERPKNLCLCWYEMRFAPKSPALLAIQQAQHNCCFEIAGPGNEQIVAFVNRVLDRFKQEGFLVGYHWGKYLPLGPGETKYGFPNSQPFNYVLDSVELTRIYGGNLALWKQKRAALFGSTAEGKAMMKLFTNDLMVKLGLA